MTVDQQQRDLTDGTLIVRSHLEGAVRVLSFGGELDLANAATAEAELAAATAPATARVVIDIGELEFIDSTGIALLVMAMSRCDGDREVRFVPSRSAAVNRVLSLTGVAERMPLLDGGGA